MLQHIVDLPWLQHLHEGQGPARRPLHHQPHLRHLRRQPRDLRRATRRTWPSASSRRRWANGSSTWEKRPNTCSTTTSSRTTWSASTSASRWSKRPIPASGRKPETTESPNAAAHGYKTIGDIMTALNPFTGDFYRETLQVSRMTREMFCLMEGRHVHPSTLYPGGVGTVPTVQLFTDYLVAADAVRRVHEEMPAAARGLVQLLVRGAARLRRGRPPADPLGLLGFVPGSGRLRLPISHDERVGQRHVRHPRHRGRRQARHHEPGRHQPGDSHPAGQLVLRRLGEPGEVRRTGSAGQPGRSQAPVEPDHNPQARRSATSAASTRG